VILIQQGDRIADPPETLAENPPASLRYWNAVPAAADTSMNA
jgi:hypothetical protein